MKSSRLGPGSKSLARNSTFRPPGEAKWNGRRSSLKQGNGFAASKAQQLKVRAMAGSIVSAQKPVDAAHVWPRSLGGCSDPMCVVPLTRLEHMAYDGGQLDLLPHLLAHGLVEELQHALGHANGDLIGLLNHVTGERFIPESGAA